MTHGRKLLNSIILLILLQFCTAGDTITTTQSLKDSNLLVSANQTFALGFFSPGNSTNRYLGIWYNKVSEQTVVWVANRDNPINDTSGVLSFDGAGNLVVLGSNRNLPVWSSNMSVLSDTTGETNRSAQLLDSGNLVVFSGDGNGKGIVVDWQSFDHPTNTWLPNMKLGVDRRIGLNRFLTSWKSVVDPGTGEYSCRMDLTGPLPQIFLYKESVRIWRTGPWIGHGWSGVPDMTSTSRFILNASYVDNSNEVTVVNGMLDPSVLFRLVLNEAGTVERLTWHDGNPRWIGFWRAPKDQCDYYSHCGANGICHPNPTPGQFECTCLPGFEPNSTRDWYLRDGSGGCVRERGGHVCTNGDGFVKVERVKVPNTWTTHVERSMGQKECEERCLSNCTCNAFASVDVSQGESGIGCVAWYGDLVDTVQFSSGGQDLFVRVDAVEYGMDSINPFANFSI